MIRAAPAAALALLAACGDPAARCRRAQLLDPAGQERFAVCIDVASTAAAREIGVSDRVLRPGEGLVLEWPQQVEACIHNTPVAYAIDAVFAAASGEVVAVEHEIPARDPAVRCHDGVLRVLELRVGTAGEVEPGDRLILSAE